MTSTDIYREVCQAEIEIQAIPSDFSAVARCLRSGKPAQGTAGDSVVAADGLMFRYNYRGHEFPLMLKGVTFRVPRASRVLLVGVNGSGKSTLLRLIAGVKMQTGGSCHVFGRHAFNDTRLPQVVAYLGDWWNNSFFLDESVRTLISNFRGGLFESERCQTIIEMLGVDPEWHINRLSDGQRRRVQILCALVYEKDLFLLDEITTDLDVIVRQNLLTFLKMESQIRGSTIIYATHIFDGLDDWEPTHILQMDDGKVANFSQTEAIPEYNALARSGHPSPYYALIRMWLVPHLASLVTKGTPPQPAEVQPDDPMDGTGAGAGVDATFAAAKQKILGQLASGEPDLSPKGHVDVECVPLIQMLNAHPDYVTTSSCGGRTVLFSEDPKTSRKGGEWIYTTHGQADAVEVSAAFEAALQSISPMVSFKFEPFILHAKAKDLKSATKLVKVALAAGYRNSGILPGDHNIVAVRCSLKIDAPVVVDGLSVVTQAGLGILVRLANEKMQTNVAKISGLVNALANALDIKAPAS